MKAALAEFYGWTYAEIGAMTLIDLRGAVDYRNKVIEQRNAAQQRR